jgi:bifunctional enzyme CysN/CysC
MVMPGGQTTRIAAVDTFEGEVEAAFPTMSVALRLADQIDISRGDMFVNPDDPPVPARQLEAMICWMSDTPMRAGSRYAIKHTTRTAKAVVDELEYRVDVNSLERVEASELGLNEIGRVHLRSSAPLMVDRYRRNRTTGSFILIDEATNDTVAAGMLLHAKSTP